MAHQIKIGDKFKTSTEYNLDGVAMSDTYEVKKTTATRVTIERHGEVESFKVYQTEAGAYIGNKYGFYASLVA